MAVALAGVSHRLPVGDFASIVSGAATVHALWGVAQILPLTPFRSGRAVAASLLPFPRFVHAVLSLLALMVIAMLLKQWLEPPLLIMVLLLSTPAALVAVREAFHEVIDEKARIASLAATAESRLSAGDADQGADLARRALAIASARRHRDRLWKTLYWASIARKDPFVAHAALGQLGPAAIDLHTVAAYLICCNRSEEALQLLQAGRDLGHRDRETTKLLIDLLWQRGDSSEAAQLAQTDQDLLTAEDRHAINSVYAVTAAAEVIQ
jgi:hypothetical protein